MSALPANIGLLIVDVQDGFEHPKWGARNNHEAEHNIARLLNAWRDANKPIFHIRHLSLESGSPLAESAPGSQIKDIAKPLANEPVLSKNVNSAFIGTDLEKRLREQHISHIVIVGLTTDHCVSTTTRMASNLGFKVYLVEDGTATFERTGLNGKHFTAQEIHEANLASLNGEFATVVSTLEILGMLSAG